MRSVALLSIGYIASTIAICSADSPWTRPPYELLPVAQIELGELLQRRDLRPEPHVGGHHHAARLLERLALLAHGDRHDRVPRVVAGDLFLLAGVLHVEVDLVLLGRLLLPSAFLAPVAGLSRLPSRPAPSASFASPAQLLERRDPVLLLLHVDVVDLLFGEIDDLPVVSFSVALRLPLTALVDSTPSLAPLPPKQVEHPAEHALELDLRLVARLDLGVQGAASRPSAARATANLIHERFMSGPPGSYGRLHRCAIVTLLCNPSAC